MSAVPRNHGMNEAAPEALVALAEEFASAGAPLQAIKCLETVAQLRTSVLPLTEVHARLRLALLLMQWADNVQAAKAHLERAQVLVLPLPSCDDLKCRVYAALASCYRLAGAGKAAEARAALRHGMDLAATCRKRQGPAHSTLWTGWLLHFALQSAALHASAGELSAALESCRGARSVAAEAGDRYGEAVCAAAAAHLHLLQAADPQPASGEAEALLARGGDGGSSDGLRLHLALLRVLSLLHEGDYRQAAAAIAPMQAAAARCGQAAGTGEGEDLVLQTLPPAARPPLLLLLSASCDRPWSSKLATAQAQLEQALRVAVGELGACGVAVGEEGGAGPLPVGEAQLSPRQRARARPFLLLALAAHEGLCHCALAASQLPAAAQQAGACRSLCARFPDTLKAQRPAALLAAGLYAHAAQCYGEAAALFAEAEQCAEPRLRALCRAQRALSLLCAGGAGCAGAAGDALGADPSCDSCGFSARALSLFASALVALRQGLCSEAKARLSRCLKCAHGELNNHELVSQTLNALGSLVQAQGDTAQAKDMLMSSFTLSKAAGDVVAQAGALGTLARAHATAGAPAEAHEMERYAAKKRALLDKGVREAALLEGHVRALQSC